MRFVRSVGRWSLALVLGIAAVELVSRLVLPPPRLYPALVPDRELGFRLPRATEMTTTHGGRTVRYALNADGFRGPELPDTPKAPGQRRIVLLGDSFVHGSAVGDDEHLFSRVGEAVRSDPGAAPAVYTLCSDAFGTYQELLALRHYGEAIAPDAVVLVVYPRNDVLNNALELAGLSVGDYLRPYAVATDDGRLVTRWPHPWRARLRGWSRAFACIEKALLPAEKDGVDWLEPTRRWREVSSVRALGAPAWWELYRRDATEPAFERAWRVTERLIGVVRDEAEALGARFLVLVVPDALQVRRDATSQRIAYHVRAKGGEPIAKLLDLNGPERRILALGERERIDVRCLLGPLRDATGYGRPDPYAPDAHLSATGHAIAARVIAGWFDGRDEAIDRRAREATGLPRWAIPDPRTRVELDPIRRRHIALAPAAMDFRDDALGYGPGIVTGRGTELLVPANPAGFIVRGVVPAAASLPCSVRATYLHGAGASVRVERHGAFALALPAPPRSQGYVPLVIQTDVAGDGVVITAIAQR